MRFVAALPFRNNRCTRPSAHCQCIVVLQLKKHLEKVEKDKELKELRNKFKMKGKITTVLGAFKRGPEEFNLPFILGVQINEMMQARAPPFPSPLLRHRCTSMSGGC